MAEEVSLLRLYVLRGRYLLNFVLVVSGVCYEFHSPRETLGSDDRSGVQLKSPNRDGGSADGGKCRSAACTASGAGG